MSAFWGMDTAAAEAHADLLQGASSAVHGLRAGLDDVVLSAQWEGPDAHRFRMRWQSEGAAGLGALCAELALLERSIRREAEQQEAASTAHDLPSSAGIRSPFAGVAAAGSSPVGSDHPWLPGVLGGVLDGPPPVPWEGGVGIGLDAPGEGRRDAGDLGGALQDWATGERVPTLAELGAAGILAAGEAGVGVYEAATGEDAVLLDDRPGGVVEGVRTVAAGAAPQSLQDLIIDNDALRIREDGPLEAGQIGIQEVHGAGGGTAYIVQVPPTEGDGIAAVPDSYGGQGASRDWASNLRLIAGQHPAAMDDVRAALRAADVPPGADVMMVGHSQGGIIANRLAADPSFNAAAGGPGTYNVTHAFSIGSPVQTVVPAQESTLSVNVSHAPSIGLDGLGGDIVPAADLGGLQVDGRRLTAPNRQEVVLDAYPGSGWDPVPVLVENHDALGRGGDPAGGYAGSVQRAAATDPTLSSLQHDLAGTYLGDDVRMVRSTVVTVGRGAP